MGCNVIYKTATGCAKLA